MVMEGKRFSCKQCLVKGRLQCKEVPRAPWIGSAILARALAKIKLALRRHLPRVLLVGASSCALQSLAPIDIAAE
jgi:hypothetical protein